MRASIVWDEYRDLILAHPDAIELPLQQILGGRVCIAERDGKIVGFSVVLSRDDGEVELDGLFVDPAAWRNGIGMFLVREAEHWAALDGANALHVTANARAEPFYVACGFAFAGEAQTRFGAARTMKKALILMPQPRHCSNSAPICTWVVAGSCWRSVSESQPIDLIEASRTSVVRE